MTQGRVAIVWRSALESLPKDSRLSPIVDALETLGMKALPVAYCEEASAAVRERLLACDGVLVWVDPLDNGRDRSDLDALLRAVAARGVWVSAHPDVVAGIGTKQVLFETRHLGWGSDTALYQSIEDFRREFSGRLSTDGCRVLKRLRGNGGQGVFRVTLLSHDRVRIQEATDRDETALVQDLAAFMAACERYLAGGGRLIDQAFQPRIAEGMMRCYMSGAELVGFARQHPMAGASAERVFGLPARKTMLVVEEPQFQGLRRSLECEWVPQMCEHFGLADTALPALWDADFLFGPKTAAGDDSFVLCEINSSCVTPFPASAPGKVAAFVAGALAQN